MKKRKVDVISGQIGSEMDTKIQRVVQLIHQSQDIELQVPSSILFENVLMHDIEKSNCLYILSISNYPTKTRNCSILQSCYAIHSSSTKNNVISDSRRRFNEFIAV